jgi:PKD repeat protein
MNSLPKDNYITVCAKKCLFDAKASKAGDAKCTLPPIATTYSNANFGIVPLSENLNSGKYFGATTAEWAFDNNIRSAPTDGSKTCILGMEFNEGFVG